MVYSKNGGLFIGNVVELGARLNSMGELRATWAGHMQFREIFCVLREVAQHAEFLEIAREFLGDFDEFATFDRQEFC